MVRPSFKLFSYKSDITVSVNDSPFIGCFPPYIITVYEYPLLPHTLNNVTLHLYVLFGIDCQNLCLLR